MDDIKKEKRYQIAEEIVPVIAKLPREAQENLLWYAKGLVDQRECSAAQADKKEAG